MIAAIVPAAGRSTRMGRPKMLLPIDGQTLIARVVTALYSGGVHRVIVVAPPADAPEGPEIASESARAGAAVVVPPARPAEMRDSVEIGLAALADGAPVARVVISPGDTPGITPDLVARLLARAEQSPRSIVVPACAERRGHPVVLPWELAALVPKLPPDLGVNTLARLHPGCLVELPVPAEDLAGDVNTPDDLLRWRLERSDDDHKALEERDRTNVGSGSASQNMRVQVRLFALARERAGCSLIDLDLAPGSQVASLRAALSRQFPALAPLLPNALIAINEDYATDDAPILPGSRVAVIPPVSGGGGELFRR
jgi:molybdenum cofactor cytidylyltransferase